ncbi:metal-dependent phosphohydrolase, partial [Desulfobacteraceae bacterium SEEP-SAG9]
MANFAIRQLSQDKRLNKLLKSVVSEVKYYAEDQIRHIQKLTEIGLALSAEKNISKLFEMVVDQARELSNADAGTLYILDTHEKHLRFEIMQNDTMNTRMGGTSGVEVTLPNVPLYIDGNPNYSNVSSYVALTSETKSIPDVYEAKGFDFTGPKNYDESTGYRSKSMLVIPMRNHENATIGVLQLLNAQDP